LCIAFQLLYGCQCHTRVLGMCQWAEHQPAPPYTKLYDTCAGDLSFHRCEKPMRQQTDDDSWRYRSRENQTHIASLQTFYDNVQAPSVRAVRFDLYEQRFTACLTTRLRVFDSFGTFGEGLYRQLTARQPTVTERRWYLRFQTSTTLLLN